MKNFYRIVADKNIPQVKEMYSSLGELTVLDGHSIDSAAVRDADIILVRSVTVVDNKLLEGSRVRFVGTATIGTDHIDLKYLKHREIGFASAPGSNAQSVAEYVLAGLLVLGERLGFSLKEKTLGVVGVGNVGRRVVRLAKAMGMRVLLNDPPLEREVTDPAAQVFVPLDRLLDADITTLHVPLTTSGIDATVHLFDEFRISRMKRGSILINSSRGKVVETRGLTKALEGGHLSAAILDVWEQEPAIDSGLLQRVMIGTPHIAGYSFDGKINGAEMIYHAVCRYFNFSPMWDRTEILHESVPRKIVIDSVEGSIDTVVRGVIRRCYDIERDDVRLREMLPLSEDDRNHHFKKLRAEYPRRREFAATTIVVPRQHQHFIDLFSALGFTVEPSIE
jgi:erythronate-4-phosphate dehydrogenase